MSPLPTQRRAPHPLLSREGDGGRGSAERLDHFMARANAAYYANQNPFTDFTTAPEVSQAFGEVLGLWATVVWDQLGRPAPIVLAEAGPGRGTLMRDALRAIEAAAPPFRAVLSVHLVETSPRLRAIQAAAVPGAAFHDGIPTLPDMPLILLANEFLDALPIRQLVRRGAGWAERFVAEGRLVEHSAPDPGRVAGNGETIELREAADSTASALGRRFRARPGAALFIDYGAEESTSGDSLQAIRGGRPADPFAEPGRADLTAHVDFAAFAASSRDAGAACWGPVPQGVFLTRLGLMRRIDRLAQSQPPARALALIEAGRRLIEPDQMGRLFKALALGSPGSATPPGFEP